jgi:2,3-bisphosphoglycerate-independent phosphoglycerate mutase
VKGFEDGCCFLPKRPLVLTILDGWGYRAETANNAIALAKKPTYDKLLREYPNTLIQASDHFVGLPDGQMGNSEVGHLNIGAGRIVQMDITRIDALIAAGEFQKNPAIVKAMKRAREGGRQLHLFGLVSDGGVHSHQEHLYALLRTAREYGLSASSSTPSWTAATPARLRRGLHRAARTEDARVRRGQGGHHQRPLLRHGPRQALGARAQGLRRHGQRQGRGRRVSRRRGAHQGELQQRRHRRVSHSFVVVDGAGKPVGQIRDEDVCINFNFRADRARQITRVLTRESGLNKQGGRDLDGWEALDADHSPQRDSRKNLHYPA